MNFDKATWSAAKRWWQQRNPGQSWEGLTEEDRLQARKDFLRELNQ